MGVSRAGYYKWKNRAKTDRDYNREKMVELVKHIHEEHPSHGHRWVNAYIKINYNKKYSDNYIYKAFKYLGIKAETKHQKHYKPRKIRDRYPNLIFTTWETVDRPRQVIVSDMTVIKVWYFYIEITFYFDVFTKQILTCKFAERRGDRQQYIEGLKDVIELLRGNKEPTIIHTDQGSVYASKAYNELIRDENIVRSMSRAGKPTDNPVNESLNGWIKEELYMDFKLAKCKERKEIIETIKKYIKYYNSQRPRYSIGYDTPNNYYRRYMRGELEIKDTFSKRKLSEVPKFVQKEKERKARNTENKET